MDELEKVLEPETEFESKLKNSPEVITETPSELQENEALEKEIQEAPKESVEIQPEDANTTNCLALTIQQDHKLMAIKNVFLRSIRMSWKVVVSTITLALIKLFS